MFSKLVLLPKLALKFRNTMAEINQTFPELECYKIEENIPVPEWHFGRKSEKSDLMKDLLSKFDRTGLSAVIKVKDKGTITKIAKRDFPEIAIKIYTIKDNPNYCRVYRTK